MADIDPEKRLKDLITGYNGVLLAQEVELLSQLTALRNTLVSLVSDISKGVFSREQLVFLQAVVTSIKGYAQTLYNKYRGEGGMHGKIANMANNVVTAADNVLHEIGRQLEKMPTEGGDQDAADKMQSEIDKLISEGKPLPFDPRQLGR
jgi:hypothetical protein